MTPEEPIPFPDEPFEKIIARISKVEPEKVETREHIFRKEARVSAKQLAEYVVSDPSRQATIIKNSKAVPKSIALQYRDVKNAFRDAVKNETLTSEHFKKKAAEIKNKEIPDETEWAESDRNRSSEATKRLASILEELDLENISLIHRPSGGWGTISLKGVKVSVNPEIVYSFKDRGITKVGAVILSTSKTGKGLSKSSDKYSAGQYYAALVQLFLTRRLKSTGPPVFRRCYAVDVFNEEVYHCLLYTSDAADE